MEIIASIFDEKSTPASEVDQLEVWATDQVNTKDQMTIAGSLKHLCSAMHPTRSDNFEMRALRKKVVAPVGHVKFGAVLLARKDVFSTAEISEMKVGCGQLSAKLQPVKNDNAADLLNVNPEPEVAPAAQNLALAELERTHGGQTLKKSIEIFIANTVQIVLKGQILDRPDRPVKDVPLQFQGSITSSNFLLQEIVVALNLNSNDKGTIGLNVKTKCPDSDLFEVCVAAGLARTLLLFHVRRIPTDTGTVTTDLVRVTTVQDGDAWPIGG